MRRILENVIVRRLLPSNDVVCLTTYLDHRVTESTKTLIDGLTDFDSTHRSTSSSVSDSVGSMSMQVEMGQEQVGGWNP